jgi:hypothetical protein
MAEIKSILIRSTNRSGAQKRSFAVTAIWNPIGWNGATSGSDLAQDKMELFLQKTAEEKFSQDFQKILAPHNQSRAVDKAAALRVSAYLDDMTPGDNSLEDSDPPKISDENMSRTQKAIRQIISRVLTKKSAILVAHSQGNLLANLAHAKLAADHGNDVYKLLRVVNVANTTAFAVSGLNFTHAKDAALFSGATDTSDFDVSLETLPSQGSNWNRTTPRCTNSACNFLLAAAPFSGVNRTGGFLDHAMVDTYLSSTSLPGVIDGQGVLFTPSAVRFVDRFEDFVYAAASSLDFFNPKTITYRVTGKVTEILQLVSPDQSASVFRTPIAVGDPITAIIKYSVPSQDYASSISTIGDYRGSSDFGDSISIQIGTNSSIEMLHGAKSMMWMNVYHQFSDNNGYVFSVQDTCSSCLRRSIGIWLMGASPSYIATKSLPTSRLNIDEFGIDLFKRTVQLDLFVVDIIGGWTRINAEIDTIALQ